jgi:exodeoxyribonuclease VII small subunit
MDEFEAVVAWFDNDNLDVEAAIAKFEEGSKLADQIETQLAEAKNKIEIVKKKFDAEEA